MRKWRIPESPVNVEKSKVFTGIVVGTIICVPFWLFVAWIIFG